MKSSLLFGDCLERLKELETNSVDSLVTDPPAGISFMGKSWDSDKGGRDEWIAWMAEAMRECHRVLKPGAHGLVWSLPRTSHWTATALENAGFEVRDCVTHLFGSGFPKSQNISIAIDKQSGAMGHRGKAIPAAGRGERHDIQDGSGWNESNSVLHKPITDAAKQWQGWGTALKPAAEFWWLIRKPLSEKTVAANVIKWGTGGINIDGSRIGTETISTHGGGDKLARMKTGASAGVGEYRHHTGRFPANLVLSHSPHCTEDACDMFECPIALLDEQSGKLKSGTGAVKSHHSAMGYGQNNRGSERQMIGDSGGASRFFYCAKISSSERNAGLDDSPDKTLAMSGGAAAAAARGESYDNGDSGMNRTRTVKNNHPTVKPKKLMSYLIKLITPPGRIVLDPFMGSGSTGLAAKENGFQFIGIEREKEYFEISKARLEHATACESS